MKKNEIEKRRRNEKEEKRQNRMKYEMQQREIQLREKGREK